MSSTRPVGPDGTGPGAVTVDLLAEDVVRDPFGAYARVREQGGLARGVIPGAAPLWLATTHRDVTLVMTDPRFVVNVADVPGVGAPDVLEQIRLAIGIPAQYLPYLKNMAEVDGAAHVRLRTLVARPFSTRRVSALRPRIEEIADQLLDTLPGTAQDGVVDLLRDFAYPLPVAVICELFGVAEQDQARWRAWSAALVTGAGPGVGAAVRGMVDAAHELINQSRARPRADLVSELTGAQDRDGDRLSDTELAALILNLVVAGYETTANLIGNGTAALLAHPDQLALLRAAPGLMPGAVEELMRWCGPALGTLVRYPTQDIEIGGTLVRAGEAVMPILAGANRDPEAFPEPARLDITRDPGRARQAHVGFGSGPHHCLGAALARQEGQVAFRALLHRFPNLALAVAPQDLRRGANPGTWHLAELPVTL